MSRRYTALESVLHDAGISRRQVQAVVWSLRAGGDTVPDEDTLADRLLRWRAKAVREALDQVGYSELAEEQTCEQDGDLPTVDPGPLLPWPPQVL